MNNEISKEELMNMDEKEFKKLYGEQPIEAGHIRTEGLNLQPQLARDKVLEMARTGELDKLRKVNPIQKPHRNKYGLGYSLDAENVTSNSLLFNRRKR